MLVNCAVCWSTVTVGLQHAPQASRAFAAGCASGIEARLYIIDFTMSYEVVSDETRKYS